MSRIGSGLKDFPEREGADETFFVLVESENLIRIRKAVYQGYLKNGGDPECWSPEEFYGHITIGFTYKDIHFPDVHKDVEGSLDSRFVLASDSE